MKEPPIEVQERLREQVQKRISGRPHVIVHDGDIYHFDFTKIALHLEVTEWIDLSVAEATVTITTNGSQEKGPP